MGPEWGGRWGLQQGGLFVPVTSPSPLPTSLRMTTGGLLPLATEGVQPRRDAAGCSPPGWLRHRHPPALWSKGSALAMPCHGAEHGAAWRAPGQHGERAPACTPAPEGCLSPVEPEIPFFKAAEEKQR